MESQSLQTRNDMQGGLSHLKVLLDWGWGPPLVAVGGPGSTSKSLTTSWYTSNTYICVYACVYVCVYVCVWWWWGGKLGVNRVE